MTKNEELINYVRNAKKPNQAIEQAFELMVLYKTFGDTFMNGTKSFVNDGDREGLLAYIEEWKSKLKEQTT